MELKENVTKPILGILATYVVLVCIASVKMARNYSLGEVIAADIYAVCFFPVILLSVIKVFFQGKGEFNFRATALFFVAVFLLGVLLNVITLWGSPAYSALNLNDWSLKRLAIHILVAYLIVTILWLVRSRSLIKKPEKSLVLKGAALTFASLLVAAGFGYIASLLFGISLRATIVFFFCLLLCVAFLMVAYKKRFSVEKIFLIIALSVGCTMVFIPPAQTGISWDDQIHYPNALAVSYGIDSCFTEGDVDIVSVAYNPEDYFDDYTFESVSNYEDQINDHYSKESCVIAPGFTSFHTGSSVLSVTSIGYLPSAVGLWLGRALHLPLTMIFTLGKLFNLLAYVGLCYLAIKKIPVKKVLLSCVALLPTSLFLASNYAYDPWLIAGMLLGVALVVRELHNDEVVTPKKWILIFWVFLSAIMVKAVYFPVLGLLFLFPKRKFKSNKQYWGFIFSIVGVAFLLVLSFVAPMLGSMAANTYAGDSRGGSDVNSAEQIAFILANPLMYVQILLSFLFGTYLAPISSSAYTVNLAYCGYLNSSCFAFLSVVPMIILVVLAIIDSNKESEVAARWSWRFWMLFLFFISVTLVASALYVSFTPVGLDTINGCQWRYLLPLLFPVLAFTLNMKIENNINPSVFSVGSLLIFGCFGFLCVGTLMLPAYLL